MDRLQKGDNDTQTVRLCYYVGNNINSVDNDDD